MNRDRLWMIALSGLIAVVAVFGFLVGISPIVAEAASADSQRATITSSNDASQTRIALLKVQYEGIGKLQTQLTSLSSAIPLGADMPVFLRELNSLSNQYGVALTNVGVSDAQKYVVPAAAAPSASGGSPASATPTPTPSPSEGVVAAAKPPVPSGPSARLLLIPVRISVSGAYADVMAFVGGLQSGERLYLLADLSTSVAGSGGNSYSVDISGNVFALPAAGGGAASLTQSATPSNSLASNPTP